MAVAGATRVLPKLLTFSQRFLFVFICIVLGAIIFMSIENSGLRKEANGAKEQGAKSGTNQSLKARISRQLNVTMNETVYITLMDAISSQVSQQLNITVNKTSFRDFLELSQGSGQSLPFSEPPENWSFTTGVHFAWTVITTIGYGTETPRTDAGKIMTILYASFGIPICLMTLAAAGDLIKCAIEKSLIYIEVRRLKREHVANMHRKVLIATTLVFLLELLLGAAATYGLYGWTYVDAVYSWFVTFSTIGFGDLVPHVGQDRHFNTSSVIGSLLFQLLALGTLASIINTKVEMLEERANERRQECCHKINSCLGRKEDCNDDVKFKQFPHEEEKIENSSTEML